MIVARLWCRSSLGEDRRVLLLDTAVTALAAILNATYGRYALFMQRITWAGTSYEILGPKQTRMLSRQPTA